MQKIQSFDDFLSLLSAVKSLKGNEYQAKCPAHDDHNPSLSVTKSNDKILVHCHAGCSHSEILRALGLTDKDLFLKRNGENPTMSNIVETYDYKDEEGNLLYQVCRTEDKSFPLRRPDAGGWEWGLGDTRRVLYNLSDIKKAIDEEKFIFLVEGEKDVNNLDKLGFTATCNPGGAKNWRESYTKILESANVVIIPDNDKKGIKHANQVSKALTGKAETIILLGLPLDEAEDVSDWIQNGGTAEELKEMVKQAKDNTQSSEEGEYTQTFIQTTSSKAPMTLSPKVEEPSEWKPEITSLDDVESEDINWLWEPYIPKRKITILEGHPGVGKTFIALMLAARISQGEQFLTPGVDKSGHPDQVLYMTAEDGLGDTLKPRLEAMGANVKNIHSLRFKIDEETGEKRFVSFHEDLEYISRAIKQVDPALVVADPLQGFLGSDVNAHRANEVRPVLAGLSDIAEEFDTAFMLIRHLTKSSRPNSISRGLGSIDFAAHARSILMAGEHPDKDDEFAITQNKGNLAEKGPSLGYRLKDNKLIWTGESHIESSDITAPEPTRDEKSAKEEAEDFLEAYLSEGPQYNKDVKDEAKSLDIAGRTLRRAKKSLGVEHFRDGREVYWRLPEEEEGEEVPF